MNKNAKNVWIIFLGLLFATSCIIYVPVDEEASSPPPQRETYEERESGGYTQEMDIAFFYDYLSPYGTWVYYSPHGYVWVPHRVSLTWRPYTYGRWAWTSFGWTWISYYEWGCIPFHYGRWSWSHRLGWFWVPGTIWSPAWVTWRWGHLYIGWAPLPPDVEFVAGFGIRSLPYELPSNYWVFIEGRYFQYDYLDRYILPPERNSTVVRFTVSKANLVARNRQVINQGVDLDHIRQVTRSEVSKYELEDVRRAGPSKISGNSIRVYRPAIARNETAKPKSFLQKEEAEAKISEIQLRAFAEPGVPVETERRLKEEQEKELRLVEQSQQKEKVELERRLEAEEKLVSSRAEKEKVKKEYEVKAAELKKQHEDEKAKVVERHKEEEKVVKKKIKKKGEID
jgi:hypothetical protein